MIFYLLRVAVVLLRELFKPRIQPTDTHEMNFRAWPWSCDFNMHVNNAQYLYFMEFGRWAFTLRSGLLRRVYAQKVQLLVAGCSLLYRRPIMMFRRFTVRTQVVAADERWFYFVQELVDHRGQVATRAVLRGMARNRDGVMNAERAFGTSAFPSPEDSSELQSFASLAREHLRELEPESRPPRV